MKLRLVVLIALMAWPAAAQDLPEPPVRYAVKAGDTLSELAQDWMFRIADYRIVQALNRIKDPRRLATGGTILIPADLLKSEPIVGRLISWSGPVTVTPGPMAVGMPLAEGAQLATGANAFATFEMPDGSRVTLPSQTRVRLTRLRRILINGAVQRDIRLDAGRASTTVTPLPNPDSRYRILTPVAVSAVRGTEFRARHDETVGRSGVEVLGGQVAAATPGATTETPVPAGFGTATTAAGVMPPRELLAKPLLTGPVQLQEGRIVAFALQPSAGAAAYHALIARDAAFVDLVTEVTGPEPNLSFDGIPDGAYFVRLTAVDDLALEGLPTTVAFERRLRIEALTLQLPALMPGLPRRFLFRWGWNGAAGAFRFALSRQPDGTGPVVDLPGLAASQAEVAAPPPGLYFWRVQAPGGAWSPPQRFEVGR